MFNAIIVRRAVMLNVDSHAGRARARYILIVLSLVVLIAAGGCSTEPDPSEPGPAETTPTEPVQVDPAPAEPEVVDDGSLFDGKTLGLWEITDFGGQGEVHVKDGAIHMEQGNDMTGITWKGPVDRINYEITLEAMRVDGTDFFCALTFPVDSNCCSLERTRLGRL